MYLLVVAAVGAMVPSGPGAPLVAAVVVTLAFAALRARFQAAANRPLYGNRNDPQAVVSRLGERLEATLAPDEVAHTIVATVRDMLRLPYVAMEAAHGTGATAQIASVGTLGTAPTRVPSPMPGAEVG